MSANNQTLIKEHKGKWYVFTDVMAESWDEVNKLKIKQASGVYDSRDTAYQMALFLDEDQEIGHSEYGVQFNRLCKDDAEVVLIEEPLTNPI